jgi:hypothetical protein
MTTTQSVVAKSILPVVLPELELWCTPSNAAIFLASM